MHPGFINISVRLSMVAAPSRKGPPLKCANKFGADRPYTALDMPGEECFRFPATCSASVGCGDRIRCAGLLLSVPWGTLLFWFASAMGESPPGHGAG
jgi:hypothetical protein